jgi:hypothetical protein
MEVCIKAAYLQETMIKHNAIKSAYLQVTMITNTTQAISSTDGCDGLQHHSPTDVAVETFE